MLVFYFLGVALRVYLELVAAPDPERRIAAVREVLDQIGIDDTPELMIFNQIDRVANGTADALIARCGGVAISALAGTGLTELVARADELLRVEEAFRVDPVGESGHAARLTAKGM